MSDLAVRRRSGIGPTVVFLSGYASTMAGGKATAIDAWAMRSGRAFARFDYRGCGESGGRFEDFTLDDWLRDALNVIDAVEGPLVLVGSSMGGWLMLLAALARPERVAALVGIAAAPDFTDWGFDAAQLAELREHGAVHESSAWFETPLVTTLKFWESGQRNRVLSDDIAIDCPVRLLHGQCDAEVPWAIATTLAARLRSDDVQVVLVKNGDHRLSRDADLALLTATLEALPCF